MRHHGDELEVLAGRQSGDMLIESNLADPDQRNAPHPHHGDAGVAGPRERTPFEITGREPCIILPV